MQTFLDTDNSILIYELFRGNIIMQPYEKEIENYEK